MAETDGAMDHRRSLLWEQNHPPPRGRVVNDLSATTVRHANNSAYHPPPPPAKSKHLTLRLKTPGNHGRLLFGRNSSGGAPPGGRGLAPGPPSGTLCPVFRAPHVVPAAELLPPVPRAVRHAVGQPALGRGSVDSAVAGARDHSLAGTVYCSAALTACVAPGTIWGAGYTAGGGGLSLTIAPLRRARIGQ